MGAERSPAQGLGSSSPESLRLRERDRALSQLALLFLAGGAVFFVAPLVSSEPGPLDRVTAATLTALGVAVLVGRKAWARAADA